MLVCLHYYKLVCCFQGISVMMGQSGGLTVRRRAPQTVRITSVSRIPGSVTLKMSVLMASGERNVNLVSTR